MNALNVLFLILISTFLVEVSLYMMYIGSPFFIYLFFAYLGIIFSVLFTEVFKTKD